MVLLMFIYIKQCLTTGHYAVLGNWNFEWWRWETARAEKWVGRGSVQGCYISFKGDKWIQSQWTVYNIGAMELPRGQESNVARGS